MVLVVVITNESFDFVRQNLLNYCYKVLSSFELKILTCCWVECSVIEYIYHNYGSMHFLF